VPGDTVVSRTTPAAAITAVAMVLAVTAVALDPGPITRPTVLAASLVLCAIASDLTSANYSGTRIISGAFLCGSLAAVLMGPAAGLIVATVTGVASYTVERYRLIALGVNLVASAVPTVAVAYLVRSLALDHHGPAFYVAVAVASLAILVSNHVLLAALVAFLDRTPLRTTLRVPHYFLPTVALNIALVTAIAAVYVQAGDAALVLVLLTVVAFGYMTRLVAIARERTREYANLSWGVLSGLIRTLDARDHRAARHCAAVARFARDIAAHEGLSERDQELAHTAGLLHDIGRFALSDRVMERGITLTDDDWQAIRRHPELGAEMLRDIGVYGPLSEIIIAHHERIDGKGYPARLSGDEIPEIAKIIAVAEVYDTLTAPDTYRTQLSSFEALTELRRVSGKQLEGRYVEALASLLAGQGTDYRHADLADYDEELAIERRMNEASGL
jgi:putative nucleotidyltransferase with HDIG domain